MGYEILNSETQSKTVCRGLAPEEQEAYLEFARKAWGSNSPQADPLRLQWLAANPNTLGRERDLLVLAKGKTIVGAHQRMRVPWSINGQTVPVPSLHDLFVLPDHRQDPGQGGLLPPSVELILAALEDENHVALFGMTETADGIYERMRVPSLKVFWLEKIPNMLGLVAQMAATYLGRTHRNGGSAARTCTRHGHDVSRIPFPTTDELVEVLALKPKAQTYPDWNVESYKWRFFHELGPRNVLLVARRAGRLLGRAIVSLGVRRGCVVARIVELLYDDGETLKALFEEIESLSSDSRATVCLAVTSSAEAAEEMIKFGWRQRKASLGARWFTRRGQVRPDGFWICGGAWDFGCDARLESQ
jgi:hypothetical protein